MCDVRVQDTPTGRNGYERGWEEQFKRQPILILEAARQADCSSWAIAERHALEGRQGDAAAWLAATVPIPAVTPLAPLPALPTHGAQMQYWLGPRV